ncbi:hypothetical protein BAUCODRAFT_479377 [Baudoinia panamericana UAMH 10762]|uniref:Uncharacterized protein n=1 Tax=Baudoinia panamericana (strain UAMH 10762) TaxID=717646 RepID=M2MIQ5_BAUPA|nr:uncharacterized protein BAUCODRAFT_479377 [Baudoinia panamericana UAMH 10762]EMC96531.1 hypothetical protein BAUCODRAFT_479377 [Baudoinia panamericana UAMH 10762]
MRTLYPPQPETPLRQDLSGSLRCAFQTLTTSSTSPIRHGRNAILQRCGRHLPILCALRCVTQCKLDAYGNALLPRFHAAVCFASRFPFLSLLAAVLTKPDIGSIIQHFCCTTYHLSPIFILRELPAELSTSCHNILHLAKHRTLLCKACFRSPFSHRNLPCHGWRRCCLSSSLRELDWRLLRHCSDVEQS